MTKPCTVIIGAAELLPALKQRLETAGDVLTFRDDETTRALETIRVRRPEAIAIERVFAATSRGAALIARLHADPALTGSEVRVMSHDSDFVRVPKRSASIQAIDAGHELSTAVETPPDRIDYRGTRRAPRFPVGGAVQALLDGNPGTLVDLSILGARVVSLTILRPNQRIRVALPDEVGLLRFNATVVWAAFELPSGTPSTQYRAGLEFHDVNRERVEAFIERHKTD